MILAANFGLAAFRRVVALGHRVWCGAYARASIVVPISKRVFRDRIIPVDRIAMHMHRDETVARRHTRKHYEEVVDVAASSSPSSSSAGAAGAGAGACATSAGTSFQAPSSKTCQTFGP